MLIPILETERLRLRAHRREDFAACADMWADSIVTRFIGGKPSSAQQTWTRMSAYLGHWSLLEFGYWAIEDRKTSAFVGDIGFADFHRDIDRSMQGVPELGWALAAAFHSRGLATEAARAVGAWGDRHFERGRTVCMIDPNNLASLRVAEKCGFAVFKRTTFNERPTLFLERTPN